MNGKNGHLQIERRRDRRYSDHRSHGGKRIAIQPLQAATGTEGPSWVAISTRIVNSSQGGLCLRLGTRLEPEQALTLCFRYPGPETTARTLAEVRWVRNLQGEKGAFLIGVRYLL
jgi:hypothetical protein